jgi:hypothetical protein
VLSQWIELLLRSLPREDLQNVVIFGSAAIALNGVDLGRPPKDLDVFVDDKTYDRLKKSIPEHEKRGNNNVTVPYLMPFPHIEILRTFPGVSFTKVHERASTKSQSQGLLVASLVDLIIWKNSQGRTKDVCDLKRIALTLSRVGLPSA